MRILLPRDLHLGNTEFDAIAVGQGVRIRLMRSRFQAKDAFIQAVGTFEGLVNHTAPLDEQVGLQPAVAATEDAVVKAA
jgi:hypothetical protein